MSTPDASRYVRLRVDLVLDITDADSLTGAALDRIGHDEFMPDEERAHAESAVREDSAEALAYLVDPFDLVGEVPGVELAQASWSSESVEFDPESPAWDEDEADDDFDDDDADDEDDEDGEGDEEDGADELGELDEVAELVEVGDESEYDDAEHRTTVYGDVVGRDGVSVRGA
ncbi:hypothetical protein [Streptomyces boluensis]|uniref:hypothetical protein n=1 Tax=Streptomyces boluensis TaxID=1775135 RepID=UPI001FE4BA74|nr:hypothetical protein [Streptomyces boluensis]